jgi:hypothetical protein
MLEALHEAMQKQQAATKPDGTVDPQVMQEVMDRLADVDFTKLKNFQQAMGQMSQADLLSAIPKLDAFNGVLEGLANGNVERTLRGAYDGLSSLYKDPNLSPEMRNLIYDRMKNLYEGIKDQGVLKGVAEYLKGNLQTAADLLGFGDLVSSLGNLAKGDLSNPQDLANRLAGVDWEGLNKLLEKLGAPGLESLKKLLPPGVDPSLLGAAFDAYRNGGIDGLLQSLTNKLADELKNAIPKDMAELQDAIDKINALKQKLKDDPAGVIGGLLGGLFGNKNKSGRPANCKTDPMQDVMIDIMASDGDLTNPPGIVICN